MNQSHKNPFHTMTCHIPFSIPSPFLPLHLTTSTSSSSHTLTTYPTRIYKPKPKIGSPNRKGVGGQVFHNDDEKKFKSVSKRVLYAMICSRTMVFISYSRKQISTSRVCNKSANQPVLDGSIADITGGDSIEYDGSRVG